MEEKERTYNELLEDIKIEAGSFFRLAEAGKVTRSTALKARKQSIVLRDMLKLFRKKSLENDKRIKSIMAEAKQKVLEETME